MTTAEFRKAFPRGGEVSLEQMRLAFGAAKAASLFLYAFDNDLTVVDSAQIPLGSAMGGFVNRLPRGIRSERV